MSEEILSDALFEELEEIAQNNITDDKNYESEETFSHNLDMILNVPLQVSVQIGKTKKPIKEIIEFKPGTIVELNKLAGEQADVLINGKCFAKGDVVIIEENFCVRITELVNNNDITFRRN